MERKFKYVYHGRKCIFAEEIGNTLLIHRDDIQDSDEIIVEDFYGFRYKRQVQHPGMVNDKHFFFIKL